MATRHSLPALQPSDFASAFPNSTKVYVESGELRVPMREIALGGGEPPLRVYDTSGPQGHDVREGCRRCAATWIDARGDVVERPRVADGRAGAERRPMPPALAARTRRRCAAPAPVTQLHYARRGVDHAGDGVHRPARGLRRRVRALRGGARPRDHPGQHQSPRARADDHRPQLRGEDQRQHRQLRRQLVDRRGSRQAALGDALGRRHGDGSVDRARTSTRRASGSCATPRCRSARCRSTRRSKKSAAGPRI